jgi:geranylgeranyl diphosphate synthase type II
MSGDFRTHLGELARVVEGALDRCLPASGGTLQEAMRYSVFAGGKRLRPGLCLMVAASEGRRRGQARAAAQALALPAACALEMIHTYSLIHDDLPCMDDDDLRRGQPTCHVVYGVAMAVLAGDALNTVAFETLAGAERAGPQVAELARSAGPAGMVGGQVEDLEAMHDEPDLERLRRIHERKTAALFAASTALGALAVDAPSGRVDRWREVGRVIGLAFQITDDILDVTASAGEMGKRTGKDAAAGKLTYPGLLGLEESRRQVRAHLQAARDHLEELGEEDGPIAAGLDFLEHRSS